MSTPRGLFRIQGEEGQSNKAFVESGTLGFYVFEQEYRESGFDPDFDELPSEPHFCAIKAEKDKEKPKT